MGIASGAMRQRAQANATIARGAFLARARAPAPIAETTHAH
jgi:hypothetical protein